jgi:hypothetical protein
MMVNMMVSLAHRDETRQPTAPAFLPDTRANCYEVCPQAEIRGQLHNCHLFACSIQLMVTAAVKGLDHVMHGGSTFLLVLMQTASSH